MQTTGVETGAGFSFVRGGVFYRLQRRLGLIPDEGLGIGRRILVFTAITWLPAVILAAIEGRAVGGTAEPLLHHFGVHVRCLLAIPAFLIGEALLEGISFVVFPYFRSSGLVDGELDARFQEELRRAERLRDSIPAALAFVLLVAIWAAASAQASAHLDELSWAVSPAQGGPHLYLSGWWYLVVGRPIFVLFLLSWLWRLVIAVSLFRGIAKLDLKLVPTHPDRAAGLGFLQYVPIGFAPAVFAISAPVAARFGHDILYHGTHVADLRLPLIALLVVILVLFLSPLAAFSGKLRRVKRESLWQYGSLIGRHGRLVKRRWILGEEIEPSAVLDAPELGPVADINAMYEAIESMRPTPLRRAPVIALVLAGLVPMLAMAAIEVPVANIAKMLLSALI